MVGLSQGSEVACLVVQFIPLQLVVDPVWLLLIELDNVNCRESFYALLVVFLDIDPLLIVQRDERWRLHVLHLLFQVPYAIRMDPVI